MLISRLCCLAFFLVFFREILANNGYEPKSSPRDLMLSSLAASGCTNLLVAHYVIDASRSSIPASILTARIAGATGFNSAYISKWISAAQSYNTALAAKAKSG